MQDNGVSCPVLIPKSVYDQGMLPIKFTLGPSARVAT